MSDVERPQAPDKQASQDRVMHKLARNVATHRRVVELHNATVTKLSESGHLDGAEAARVRLANARRQLDEALEQERLNRGGS